MTLLETLRHYRRSILDLASHYGARDVRLFGSVARGDDSANSDIDLLVRFDPDRSLLDHGKSIDSPGALAVKRQRPRRDTRKVGDQTDLS